MSRSNYFRKLSILVLALLSLSDYVSAQSGQRQRTGLILGIVGGVLGLVLITVAIVYFLCKRRRDKSKFRRCIPATVSSKRWRAHLV